MNNGILKPGTPCYLAGGSKNDGRVVEVVRFLGKVVEGKDDLYFVKSPTPIEIQRTHYRRSTGEVVGTELVPNMREFNCFRQQLIPIIPPELDEQTQKHVENTINQGT